MAPQMAIDDEDIKKTESWSQGRTVSLSKTVGTSSELEVESKIASSMVTAASVCSSIVVGESMLQIMGGPTDVVLAAMMLTKVRPMPSPAEDCTSDRFYWRG